MKASLLAAVLAVAGVSDASAQSGASGVFQVVNNTDGNTVVGFYTNDGSGWSSNWLSDAIPPGASAEAQFSENSGPCEQVFQIGWLGKDGGEVLDDPTSIDICQASNVYLGDNEITFD